MEPINKKTCVDTLYELAFKGELVRLYARSDKQAIQRAIEHFRPSKRDRKLVVIWNTSEDLLSQVTIKNQHQEMFYDSYGKEAL